MAAGSPVENLWEEATCPLCLEYFTAPVTLECGHNFCQACISRCWEGPGSAASCPQCRETVQQGPLRPNRQLANMVELVKRLSLQAPKGAGVDGVCGEHQEALKLFCEEDQTSICVICHLSQAHRAHRVVPIREAAQEYQEKIQAHLKTLREEREKLLGRKVTGQGRSQEYLIQTQAERQKVVAEFQQLRQFLDEQEQLLLAQLEKLDEEIGRLQTETLRKLSGQISCVSEWISELEGKCQKPASEFLQDVRSTLSRCETGPFQPPEEISLELDERVRGFSQQTTALSETLREFTDTLPSALDRGRGPFRQATVTLDPDTAHPNLVLSEDQKHVRREHTRKPLPNNPERFDSVYCVLGHEGFTSGRHCWEVDMEVGGGQCWAVGVARESVGRKGGISLSPEGGIWAVHWGWDQFQALTSPETPLPLSAPCRIRVCLDCDWGQVTFIDAGAEAPIFTFPPGSLPGERIRPWLGVWTDSPLSLCPSNQPL
ncbi:zinc finger protein RFP-like isoform X1 [Pelodiscus sinensis]|uniref:zinc finger protein RFP-like isoform X1 n=1 Tax=Pelodiscus sinensis TaxID=13735 RepID=UPI000D71FABE|nr:zinc finger protein RFP-like isoform X1 [Pelodiscus sinensis]XP_025045655.1 zinc finger protein RFP-like isoform X2 [Pelodiscus sinensis]|eukprot:XP_014434275.2 zinc finger protein RFP-like isoform X1 [Pelodiscus sinensis]